MSNIPSADDIAAAAMQPKTASADGTSVTMASANDQIDAASFAAANKIAKRPARGIKFSRIMPGSAVGADRRP